MNATTKTTMALMLAAVVGLGAGAAYARGPGDCGGPEGMGKERMSIMRGMDPAQMREKVDQRLGELNAALKLRPEQTAAWADFSGFMRNKSAKATEQMQSMRDQPRPDTAPERMARMEAFGKARMQAMGEMREATESFYGQLDATQQKIFDEQFSRFGPRMHEHGPRHRGPMGGGRMG